MLWNSLVDDVPRHFVWKEDPDDGHTGFLKMNTVVVVAQLAEWSLPIRVKLSESSARYLKMQS